ncbi:MAG: hypothetical protein R3352_04085 [Salinisphaeraceae bacterium]|nr:hypothetical protein [Salinisphaeraceae bacterium]
MKPIPREELAQSIARLMHEQGIQDFQQAKRKAVQRTGHADALLPSNAEIADALRERTRLQAAAGADTRTRLLMQALEVMQNLAEFQPRLSGRVAAGLITDHSWLQLHVFCETPEELDIFLQARGIEYQPEDKRMRFHNGHRNQPAFVFEYQGTDVLTVVFSPRQRSQKPLSPIDGKPMARLSSKQIEALLLQDA